MTLVVEDGTGMIDAEAYVSVADADARHSALGNTAWTGTEAVKEAAIRRATQFMEQRYRSNWRGTKLTREQALSWPRYGAVVDGWCLVSNEVPDTIANACADLALKALAEDLNPDLERAVIREKVGPLETEYSAFGSQSKRYTAATQALAPYLMGSGANRFLVRA